MLYCVISPGYKIKAHHTSYPKKCIRNKLELIAKGFDPIQGKPKNRHKWTIQGKIGKKCHGAQHKRRLKQGGNRPGSSQSVRTN